jgi:hypothetical protein
MGALAVAQPLLGKGLRGRGDDRKGRKKDAGGHPPGLQTKLDAHQRYCSCSWEIGAYPLGYEVLHASPTFIPWVGIGVTTPNVKNRTLTVLGRYSATPKQ